MKSTSSRRLRSPILGAVLLSSSIVAAGASAPAQAEDYIDTFNFSVDSIRCGFAVSVQFCNVSSPFEGGARSAKAGDTFTATISFDAPFQVPGSTGASVLSSLLVDATAYPGGLAPGPNAALSSLTVDGYSGPPFNLTGQQSTTANFGYDAFAGVCCGSPVEPFSFTSAEAHYQILSDGVRPLEGIAFGYIVTLDATPQVLANFQGGNPDAPVFLPEGLVGEITGNIGGPYPLSSFYGLNWQGGLFQTQASVVGADPGSYFNFKLFDSLDNLVETVRLDQSNNFDALITVGALDPGRYKIGLATSEMPDPSFSIRFLTPVGLSGAVPEPATWAMLIVGFGFVGGALRSARNATVGRVRHA